MSAKLGKTESIITVSELKKRYFHGVKILDEDNNELEDDVYEDAINQAISWLEHELEIDLTPTDRTERYDLRSIDYTNWSYIRLRQFPVLRIDSFKALFPGNQQLIEFPPEWVRLYNETGEVSLVPTAGTISQYFITSSGVLPHLIGSAHVPQFFEIKYITGFDYDSIPYIINKAIGLRAAIDIFDIAGDLIVGAGIANYSLGVDGLSQSVGTTSSATNAGYGARILSYGKQLEKIMKRLNKYYKGVGFFVA